MNTTFKPSEFVPLFLRIALAASFLSAVADRFGLWGSVGTGEVTWGNFDSFVSHTALLLWYLPKPIVVFTAWLATILEVIFSIGLLVGIFLRYFAFASGILLALFAVSMTIATGVEGPFSYSVWTASAGAFLLSLNSNTPSVQPIN